MNKNKISVFFVFVLFSSNTKQLNDINLIKSSSETNQFYVGMFNLNLNHKNSKVLHAKILKTNDYLKGLPIKVGLVGRLKLNFTLIPVIV